MVYYAYNDKFQNRPKLSSKEGLVRAKIDKFRGDRRCDCKGRIRCFKISAGEVKLIKFQIEFAVNYEASKLIYSMYHAVKELRLILK